MSVPEPLNKQIKIGIQILIKGGVLAFPTDTVYGLGASIFDEKAVARIYKIKQRPQNMALPVLISNVNQLRQIVNEVPEIVEGIAKKFWPGALTLVLFKSQLVPDIVTAGEKTIAVRMPAHPVPLALIEGLGKPIIGTSANVSGIPSPITAEGVKEQLGKNVDLIIDGGKAPGGKESTIIDLTKREPQVLRQGPISLNDILKKCR